MRTDFSTAAYRVLLWEKGGFFNIHSGDWEHMLRTPYNYADGKFSRGMINILVALTDIGPAI